MARRGALVALALGAGLVAGPAASATAQEPQDARERTRIEVPMTVAGTWERRSDGTIQVSRSTEFTLDEVVGDCGSSYVEIEPLSGGFEMFTGFTVTTPAVSYDWSVFMDGPDFVELYTAGGPLLFRTSWNGREFYDIERSGTYTAVASGQAFLVNGLFCTSGGPTDQIFVTS